MAAIDKIYVSSKEEYLQFKEWCEQQPPLLDKYGKKVLITTYLYGQDDSSFAIFNAPCYVDAYVIKNCPFDFIQKELMLNYGHWSQEKVNEAYDVVTHRDEGNMLYYQWLTEEDFKIVDGVITMPNLEESDYSKIKRGYLYSSPLSDTIYTVGKHFKCIRHPAHMYNTPLNCNNYFIDIITPKGMPYMWYHKEYNSWDFMDDFVASEWSSSTAYCKTIRALKRLIRKWKLPIGTTVRATGRYFGDEYLFVVKA